MAQSSAVRLWHRLLQSIPTATFVISSVGCGGASAPSTYRINASISGLSGSQLVLQLNAGSDLAVMANGTSTFAASLTSGATYQVTVKSQPASPQQVCAVKNGSGAVQASDVTVDITCTTVTHTVQVSVSGLSGTGLVLQLNGAADLSIDANGAATFTTAIDSGSAYTVAVSTQPTHPVQTCSIADGSGTVADADVSGIAVTCVANLTTLYAFTGNAPGSADGAGPNGSLIEGQDGNFYGTTFGTAFQITPSGMETTLYSFPQGLGASSTGLILASDGYFYGTTTGFFGSNVSGTLYRTSPTGSGTELAIFGGADTGDFPLIGGVIQGTTGQLYVTAFASWIFGFLTNITFTMYVPEQSGLGWQAPGVVTSTLVQGSDGNLYGITLCGGNAALFKAVLAPGSGTVTATNILGNIPVNVNTTSGAPVSVSSLIEGNDGNFYGTTSTGGNPSPTCPQGCGTVYKITPGGIATLLYSFGGSAADGQSASGALVLARDGNFYGTTLAGGTPNTNCVKGCGTIYRLTPSGQETVLYSFGTNASDGVSPSGALLQARDGNLYGTTYSGGPSGSGTVFRLDLGVH